MNWIRNVVKDLSDRREEVRWVLFLTFMLATILVAMASGAPYLRNVMAENPEAASEFREDLLWMSIWLYAWLLIVPIVYVLAARVSIERPPTGNALAVYLGGFLFAYAVHVGIQILAMLLPAFEDVHDTMSDAVIHHMLSGIYLLAITYGGIAAACHAIAANRRTQELEMRRVRLEAELVETRMHALRNQLHPHFLFNALNSVSTLMYRDVEAADDMLSGIADLLRVLIKDSDRILISLREEIQFVDMYVRVEKIRHGDRLDVRLDVPAELGHLQVPPLVLQPVVENAIKHGTSRITEKGRINIEAGLEADRLRLSVSDNGPGFSTGDGAVDTGVGIANLRARLSGLYGNRQELKLRSGPEGARVDILIPFDPELSVSNEPAAS